MQQQRRLCNGVDALNNRKYPLKAVWTGDAVHSEVSTTINFDVTPYEQNVFSVATNSTLTELFFDLTKLEPGFRVEGPDGTKG